MLLRQDEFAERFKVSVAELEKYAALGLLFPKRMDDHIAYDERSVLRMQIIQKGDLLGFSLSEIAHILEEPLSG